ncbi:MAG: hypothetical protein P1P84_02045 [Deferrisomatales bacterium]|nr:hypothetical protein [Deferrisomatales bacterium]
MTIPRDERAVAGVVVAASPAPEMTVILATRGDYRVVRKAITCLRQQSVRKQLEVLVVTPRAHCFHLDEPEIAGDFLGFRVLGVGPEASTASANAVGIAEAAAPVVTLTEDHSFPAPDWAYSLIRAHRGDYAAVGPVVRNANPGSATSWADFLIGYGKWMDRPKGHEIDFLPGHNSSYKRQVLMAYGSRLGEMLEVESVLHWDLRANRHRLYLEPTAKTAHVNFSRLSSFLRIQYLAGRLFAAARASGWGRLRRTLYVVGGPLIPLVRLWRVLGRVADSGSFPIGRLPRVLSTLLLRLCLDGLGQFLGYSFGAGSVKEPHAQLESNRAYHVTRSDRGILLPGDQGDLSGS